MIENVVQRDPVEQLAEEFMARLRQGERPSLSEYTGAHPELADEIRDLFPALVMMEEVKPAGTEPSVADVNGPDSPPTELGEYRILREVARGGMGVVYEAEQVSLGRHVALKVLPARSGEGTLRLLRFRREARSAARLHHTNIVPVFDVGVADGVHYYAMQFIRGQGLDEVLEELRRLRSGGKPTEAPAADLTASLADGLRTGVFAAAHFVTVQRPSVPPRPSEASAILTGPVSHYFRSVVRLGVQAAEALAYAHGQRVLHRDVKPSNLLLDRQGTLWLTDFGLAKDDGDDLTRTGDIVGTLRYMAPERFQGISDPRTDVYALGVTLYELLTLRPAFPEADRVQLIQQIAAAEPAKPRAIDPTIPGDLETIVLKAIEKEPGRRYPTAAEMAEDLRRFLADRPIKARRASWREQAWRWCRRNPGVAASLSLALAMLVLLIAGLSVGTVLIWQAKEHVEAALGEEKLAAYFQRIALADREMAANNVARAEELLAQCPPGLRRWEWHYLNRSRGKPPLLMRHGHAVNGESSLGPDGTWLATSGLDGTVTLWDLATGKPARPAIRAHTAPGNLVACSPDGRYLVSSNFLLRRASAKTGEVRFLDPRTGALLHRWEYPNGNVQALAFSPDGRRLAVAVRWIGGDETTVEIRGMAEGPRAILPGRRHEVTALAFSPDCRSLASAGSFGEVLISDAHTGRTVHELRDGRAGGRHYWCLAFSPDGHRLAAGYGNEWQKDIGGVKVWDVNTGRECGSVKGHDVFALAYGPDGRLSTGGNDGTVRVWEAERGREMLTLRGHTDVVTSVAFTPDGHRLVTSSADRTVRVWDATPMTGGESTGDESLSLSGHTEGIKALAFDPTGRRLASGSADGTVRVWDARAGFTPVGLFRPELGTVHALAYDPEGKRLAVAGDSDSNGKCAILDATTGRVSRKLVLGDDDSPHRLAFSPDGTLVAGCDMNGEALVWDAETGGILRRSSHPPHLYGVAFGPDPRRPLLATASTEGKVRVCEPATGAEVTPPLEHPAAGALAFSRDGRRLATAGWDKVVRIWDTATWKAVETYRDPTGGANSLAFSPDGTLVAWGGTDSTVKVWRLGTDDVATLRGHRHWAWDVAFSPDGEHLASASRDAIVKVWKNPFPKK